MGKFNKLITCFMMYDKKVFHVTAAVEGCGGFLGYKKIMSTNTIQYLSTLFLEIFFLSMLSNIFTLCLERHRI